MRQSPGSFCVHKISISSFLVLGLALLAADACCAERLRPNIVYILADDMGRGDISAYNARAAWKTPHIDSLAREGTMFTDAHSSSAVCTPSRYSILTGRYSWRGSLKSGVIGGLSSAIVEPGRLTVPAFLRQQGYTTAMIGKWHLGLDWARSSNAPSEDSSPGQGTGKGSDKLSPIDYAKPFNGGPTAHGFDFFLGISASLDMAPYVWLRNDRVDAELPLQSIKGSNGLAMWRGGLAAKDFVHADVLPREAEEAVRYIGQQQRNKPFFLYLALTAPHTPIVPTEAFAGKTHTTAYGDFCVQVDAVVGQILHALDARGLAEDTLVVFTADNGCSPGSDFAALRAIHHDPQAGLRGYKADIYEGGHRIPFLVRWPKRVPANRVSNELICQSDLLATCADIVGGRLPSSAGEDSVSIRAALFGDKLDAPLREALVHHSINGSFAIRQGPWKLCLTPDSGGWSEPRPGTAPAGSPPFQLFNLERDPGEKNNLYAEHPEVVRQLGLLLKGYVLKGRSTPGVPQANKDGTAWRELAWMAEFK